MKRHRTNTTMSNDFAVSFKQVAAASLPTGPWKEVLPLQEPLLEVEIRRLKLIRAEEELRQGWKIILFGGSQCSDHCRSMGDGVLDLAARAAHWPPSRDTRDK